MIQQLLVHMYSSNFAVSKCTTEGDHSGNVTTFFEGGSDAKMVQAAFENM